jgi:Ribbon-helix-helix protein, copG family
MNDGMSSMVHRTTFALDKLTAKRLRRLAALWNVSQAEVVRRAVAQAEAAATVAKPDPVALLGALHASGQGLDVGRAEDYLSEVRENREHWRVE